MSNSPDHQSCDASNAGVTLFKNNYGDPASLSEVGSEQALDPKFSVPYEIIRVLENDRYMVKKVVGRGRSRKVAHDQLRRAPQPGDQGAVSAGDDLETLQNNVETAPDPVPSTSRAGQPVQITHDDEHSSSD